MARDRPPKDWKRQPLIDAPDAARFEPLRGRRHALAKLSPRETRTMPFTEEVEQEAFNLLDLIDIEFETDPMSQQCFDARIVARVKAWVAARRKAGMTAKAVTL